MSYKTWHKKLVAYWVNKYKYSEAYCDAVAIGKRNYYPMAVGQVPFR